MESGLQNNRISSVVLDHLKKDTERPCQKNVVLQSFLALQGQIPRFGSQRESFMRTSTDCNSSGFVLVKKKPQKTEKKKKKPTKKPKQNKKKMKQGKDQRVG